MEIPLSPICARINLQWLNTVIHFIYVKNNLQIIGKSLNGLLRYKKEEIVTLPHEVMDKKKRIRNFKATSN